jgi:hypothetical protein
MAITFLPRDIIKNVTYKNWKKFWNHYMVSVDFKTDEEVYVYTPDVTFKFINKIVKSMVNSDLPKICMCSRCKNKRIMSPKKLKKFIKGAKEMNDS